MKKYLVLVLLFLIVSPCFASEKFSIDSVIKKQANCKNCNYQGYIAQRGCCSHHGGVGGCYHGRVLCNDGTLSPTCRCLKDDIQPENYQGYRL